MKKILLPFIIITWLSMPLFSQTIALNARENSPAFQEPVRSVDDRGLHGITITYTFSSFNSIETIVDNEVFQQLNIKDFTHTKEVGKPALPLHTDIVALPVGAVAEINIEKIQYKEYDNYNVYPALEPATDTYGADEPEFVIDRDFYDKNTWHPSSWVELTLTQQIREATAALIEIRPVMVNPKLKKIRVISSITYTISFTGGDKFVDASQHTDFYLSMLPNYFLNNAAIYTDILQQQDAAEGVGSSSSSNRADYIIITHTDYLAAADSLAAWKSQLGYKTEIVSSSSWTSSQIVNEVHQRYQNWSPKPDYLVLIGDHDKVPGQLLSGSYGTFASDLYYVCMNGSNDYYPDMAKGRISVSNATEAVNVVNKIISYERSPVQDSSFYQTGLNAAYFQHAGNGYAERRFAQTSENIRDYINDTLGYTVNRVYYTGSTVNPTYWNNGYYSNGEPLPSYLLKPGFPWNGNATDIINHINTGSFYVFHRDHGFEDGWGDPYFTSTHLNSLSNGNKMPVVFSINCLTGKFLEPECFAEKFLRLNDKGAVGVFAHAEVSLSGYNDGLSIGLVDAIWSNPGYIPNFTGSGGVSNPTVVPHNDIVHMGFTANQGLIRMIETWGNHQYTHELFHYYGDPAMRIWTAFPTAITATHQDTIMCLQDTMFTIFTSSCLDGLATLTVDGELVGKTTLINGFGVITFTPFAGASAVLTISKRDHAPYTAPVYIDGGCPKAKFALAPGHFCLQDSVTFIDKSFGNISSYLWDFGAGAIPATDTTAGDKTVLYTTPGSKTVQLVVSNSTSPPDTFSMEFSVSQYCEFIMPSSGNQIIDICNGKLYDNGGPLGDYPNNSSATTTIEPPGASSISLTFSSFNYEAGYDYLYIYDGPSTASPLIGQYDGSSLPGGGIINSTTGSITLHHTSDGYVTASGFELQFNCYYPNQPPVANFITNDTISCTGEISFQDHSLNVPNAWLWDFGDGNSSTVQHPVHTYAANGTYTVTLLVTNSFGSDSLQKTNYVTINRPNAPNATDAGRCGEGAVVLTASGNGDIYWYSSPSSASPVAIGSVLTTPPLSTTTTFFCEDVVPALSVYGAKSDNSGGGSYFTASATHYLEFNCHQEAYLVSVLVYAGSSGNRTIQLHDATGAVLKSKTVALPSGQSRVTLNWDVPVANNLRLVGPLSPDLYRNNNGTNYPYTVGNFATITNSSASSNPTGYYYYFYDWEMKGLDCISPRTPVQAIIYDDVEAGFEYTNNDPVILFTDTSHYATTYHWDFGDGNTSAAQNPSHTYSANGTYHVVLTASNANCEDTASAIVYITALSIDNPEQLDGITIYPNPAESFFYIDYTGTKEANISLTMYNETGQLVLQDQMKFIRGTTCKIETGTLAKGNYTLNITSGEKNITSKIIIQ